MSELKIPMSSLPPGTQLDGRYEIIRVLGEGGMATVYLVRHLGLHSLHALKVLSPELAVHEEVRARFLSEGRIQAKVRHPNLLQVTEIVTSPTPGLVMDFVEGGTLAEWLAANGRARSTEELLALFLPVLDGLGAAHRAGVVHRDLKPENILLGRDASGRPWPRVTDFGIARVAEDTRRTRAGARMGTPFYMSPEQVHGADQVDAKSDIFSLGAILYELATGRRPFTGQGELEVLAAVVAGSYVEPDQLVPGLAPEVVRCIKRALRVEPGLRFSACDEFAAGLRGTVPAVVPRERPAQQGAAVPGPTPTAPAVPAAWGGRSARAGGTWAVAAAALAVGVAIFLLGFWGFSGSQPRGAPAGSSASGMAPTRLARLDKTEVTVEAYADCIIKGACTVPRTGGRCNYGQPGKDRHPINCVDWFQAKAYCQFQGKRLPTAAEWESAASNDGTTLYPWGNTPPTASLARFASRGSQGGTAEVGSYPDGATNDGLQDLAGNVFEWVESVGNGVREVRGGSWFTDNPAMMLASYRLVLPVYQRDTTYGFRCAK